jgi:hypothetical protein
LDTSADRKVRRRDVAEYVKDEPLTALAIASVAGFILGGGITRRLGFAMLTTASQIALRVVATSMIVGIVTGADGAGNPHMSTSRGRGSSDGGRDDNARANFQKPD